MYMDLLKILRCPHCEGVLKLKDVKDREGEEIINALLGCDCGRVYRVMDGVLHLGSQEQEFTNNWSSHYEEMKYEELDRQIDEKTPKGISAINDKAKMYIVQELNQRKPDIVLDVASGRGMLATHVAKNIEYSPILILTDLSFQVLKYDRLKLKKINPNLKANYIACDCTQIPIADSSVDCVLSFYGIANMCDAAAAGIKDCYRILKTKAKLLNAGFFINCETTAAQEIAKAFREQLHVNAFEEILSREGVEDAHRTAGFADLETVVVGEGIGEKNELDAVPIEGEWFALAVLKGYK